MKLAVHCYEVGTLLVDVKKVRYSFDVEIVKKVLCFPDFLFSLKMLGLSLFGFTNKGVFFCDFMIFSHLDWHGTLTFPSISNHCSYDYLNTNLHDSIRQIVCQSCGGGGEAGSYG